VHSVRIFVHFLATLATLRAQTRDQTSKSNCTDAVDADTVVCALQTAKRALDLLELLFEMARHRKLGLDNLCSYRMVAIDRVDIFDLADMSRFAM
jgi:hypothetical protein